MDKKILTYFEETPTVEGLTREALIRALLKHHTGEMDSLKKEVQSLKKEVERLEKEREEARKERDRLNEEVKEHKAERQRLHILAGEKRREFFVLMERLDDLEKVEYEMEEYRQRLDKLEWELQTTAITASDEKAMIKRMESIYSRLTEANQEAQARLGIQERLSALTNEITGLLAEAQRHHEELLRKAEESEKFHEIFREKDRALFEARLNLRRRERRIEGHQESIDYWKDFVRDAHE